MGYRPFVLWPTSDLPTYERDLRALVLLVQQVNYEGSRARELENMEKQRAKRKKKPMSHG